MLGDHHGAVVHLGERECSIQRRHQKLLEEGPSVAVTEKMRRKLGSTVVDAARAVQYTNAGTFEFLLDDKGNFFFLEVNTRVQVEHPVTEFITGIDIVKEQIRIAAGERLSFKQGDVTFTGHSIECRVNAEDPVTFAPSPGVIHAFSVPGGPGVRVDTFAHSECTISPYYDSMIAKIIVHGRDRQEAIARMRRTLEMTVIEGIKTSIPLHLKILTDPDFIAGRLSTSFMERYLTEKKKPATHGSRRGRVASVRRTPCRTPLSHRRRRSLPRSRPRAAIAGARVSARRGARPAAARQERLVGARFCDLAADVVDAAGTFGAAVIVNDRADIAQDGAARPAFTSDRTICRRTRVRDRSGRRRRSACRRTTPAQVDEALRNRGRLRRGRPGLRHRPPRTPATPRAVSTWCGAPPAGASRSWRSAGSRWTGRPR